MILVKKVILPVCLLCLTNLVHADWSGGIEAGARIGSDDRPALRFFATKTSNPWTHFAYLDWIRESGGSNYRIGYDPTFRISHSFYSFGRFSVEIDDPDGIEREFDALAGVGNNLFQRGNTRVKIEAGLAAQHLRFEDSTEQTDGFTFVSAGVNSSLLKLLRFDASLTTKLNDESTEFEGEAGFSIPIGPGTKLLYVYQFQRFNFDDRANIVSEDNFFTISYGF